MFKELVKKIYISLASLITLALILLGRIDRTPLQSTEEYKNTFLNVEKTLEEVHNEIPSKDTLLIGWSAKSIVPNRKDLPMAGYGYRTVKAVRDTLYARAFAFDDGVHESFVLTLDLMIFPIEVRKRLSKELPKIGLSSNNILYSAIHTHNGVGGFNPSVMGNLSVGQYSEEVVQKIVKASLAAIKEATANKVKGSVGFAKTLAPEWVTNRIVDHGTKENSLRVIKLNRIDGTSAAIVTFNAHATCIDMDYWILSRDYTGEWIDNLEASDSIDFAAYCAGMVASHGPANPKTESSFDHIKDMGKSLADSTLNVWNEAEMKFIATASIYKIPIDFRPSQVRIDTQFNIKVRDWVFKLASGGLHGNITYFKLGDIDWFGMPSDFSGEIALDFKYDSIAKAKNKEIMITSFNGDYVGYITCDTYYDSLDSYEVREMNWVGPEYGAYFGDIIKELIEN
ncbi:hypothetical protein EI427_18505 [Flammeovirga pectinis]|uniref:Neutral ceramidase n=1 Tax=Flammeovirga pectinis TaxID=2494373 RepID=A0A3Q9FSJ9_9BACT|nr:hypothetical protein EI427_18505 [Flammeovirga pectinis]